MRFAVSSLILLLVLMIASFLLAQRIARQEALRDARMRGAAIGNLVAGPLVNTKVRAHQPGASDALTTVMRNRMSDGSVIHIKIWDKDGQVLWSDEKELIGRRFPFTDDVGQLFATQDVTAEISSDSAADTPKEKEMGEMLEVNAGVVDADEKPLVFEAYFSTDRMRQDEQDIFIGFLPIIFAALLLFQIAVLPLAVSLARRVERGLTERSTWMRHALLASDLERRRMAQDLHDGVIQDLAGVSYAIPMLEAQLGGDSAGLKARETSRRVSQILEHDVAALRSMMTDVYPPELEGTGFATAVHELARSAGEGGVRVEVDMSPDLSIPLDTARLAYRVIREGLRNITKHALATAATVKVWRDSERMGVSVSDDGCGVQERQHTEGHLGLRLLEDTVRDLGGQLTLRSAPSGGAVLEASFPVGLVQP